jgi:hypothetical protein
MPVETIASAVSRISFSETLQPNLFQLFHPIGGVFPSPLSRAAAGIASKARKDGASQKSWCERNFIRE